MQEKSIVLIFILFILLSGCYSSSKQSVKQESIMEIEFQDFFREDTVALEINNCKIFSDKVVSSNRITGTTDLTAVLFNYKQQQLKVTFDNQFKICNFRLGHSVVVSVTINSVVHTLTFEPQKGKYFGINRNGNSKIDVLQLARPFQHE